MSALLPYTTLHVITPADQTFKNYKSESVYMRSRTKGRYKNTNVRGAVTEFRTGQSEMIMHNSVLLLFLVYINVNIRKYMHCLILLPLSPKLRSFNFANGSRGFVRISSTRSHFRVQKHTQVCV
jgi:hypothetical protein